MVKGGGEVVKGLFWPEQKRGRSRGGEGPWAGHLEGVWLVMGSFQKVRPR